MLRFERPRKPHGFDGNVAQARAALDAAILRGQQPVLGEAEAIWRQYKSCFIRAQHDKCAYCETFAQNHPGAVEHFAPKSEVRELMEEGRELRGTANVRGRRADLLSPTGYFWLTYDWDNWLLACERCNTAYKGSLFPVAETPYPLPPSPHKPVTPLLLHPYGDVDPVLHLAFDELGQVAPRGGSPRGDATIRTCGLQRESLRRARQGSAADAVRHARRLLSAMKEDDGATAIAAIEDLLALGGEERAHAGLVRSILFTEVGVAYEALPDLHAALVSRRHKRTQQKRRK